MSRAEQRPLNPETIEAPDFNTSRGYYERAVHQFLNRGNVQVGGTRPWDIQVKDCSFFSKMALGGSLGLGEAYMDGLWDCAQLDEFFHQLIARGKIRTGIPWLRSKLTNLHASVVNKQSRARAFVVGEKHYDVGNDLYEQMLDPRMVYTCAYWNEAASLDEAQEAKLDLVCRKIGLREGDTVLDIGCGW